MLFSNFRTKLSQNVVCLGPFGSGIRPVDEMNMITVGNDGRMEPKGVAASTLYAIKMKESEGILEKMR